MPTTTKTVNVSITFPDEDSVVTTVSKRKVSVENGATAVLQWVITGDDGSFHETNPFTWNTSATEPPPPTVTRRSNTMLESTEYTNTVKGTSPLTWRYTLRVTRGTATVAIDPEVDNEAPPH